MLPANHPPGPFGPDLRMGTSPPFASMGMYFGLLEGTDALYVYCLSTLGSGEMLKVAGGTSATFATFAIRKIPGP